MEIEVSHLVTEFGSFNLLLKNKETKTVYEIFTDKLPSHMLGEYVEELQKKVKTSNKKKVKTSNKKKVKTSNKKK